MKINSPNIGFETLGTRAEYPHEAPQWIPSRSREDIRNRIQYYMKHPTKMRPYMGNRGYYTLHRNWNLQYCKMYCKVHAKSKFDNEFTKFNDFVKFKLYMIFTTYFKDCKAPPFT